MAGTALTVGIVGALAALTFGVAAVGTASVAAQQTQAAADSAALAAADVASGALPSAREPCAAASALAHEHNASLTECTLNGVVVTVTVSKAYAGVSVTSRARAGPPNEQ